jgi:hypothetical protein
MGYGFGSLLDVSSTSSRSRLFMWIYFKLWVTILIGWGEWT